MAEITGLTAARMLGIEAASVVGGEVVGDDLILERHDGSTFNAGEVKGADGAAGTDADSAYPGFVHIPAAAITPSAQDGGWVIDSFSPSGVYQSLKNEGGVAEVGDYLEWRISIETGIYKVQAVYSKHTYLNGQFLISVGGVGVHTFDGYAATSDANFRETVSNLDVTVGGHTTLRLEITGKNATADYYGVILGGLTFQRTGDL